MSGVALVPGKSQLSDSNGNPLAGGTVDVYLAGTTTRTNSWQDQALTSLNTNPIVLDASGSCSMWLDGSTLYKLVVKNAAGATQSHLGGDNISGASGSASLVTFLQAGTGAVSRSGQSKMREWVTPEDFGAVGDGTTNDATALQNAADYAASVNLPLRIDNTYAVEKPIYVPQTGAHWFGRGRIKNTYAGGDANFMLAINPGNLNPAYWSGYTYYGCNAATAGERFATTTVSANAANFAAGDIVFVRSQEYYLGFGGITLPLYGSMNRVASVNAGTGVIELEFPILEGVTNLQIAKANTATVDILGLRTLYCCYGARIDGVSIESVNGHALERGGMLGCDFYFPEIKGKSGIFTNAVCFSRVRVDRITCDWKPFDLAGNSVGSNLEIGAIAYRKTARSVAAELFSMNESAWHNRVRVNNFAADDWNYASQILIQFSAANNCELDIGVLSCAKLAGSAVLFWNVQRTGVGETQNDTKGNKVRVGLVNAGAALERFGYFRNDGTQLANNTLEMVKTAGSPTAFAVTLSGDTNTLRGNFAAGQIQFGTATNCAVDVVAPGGLNGLTRTSGNTVRLNGSDYVASPHTRGGTVRSAVANGGGAGIGYTPDLLLATVHSVTVQNATSFQWENPTNIAGGDEFYLEIINANVATALTPTFGTSYKIDAGTVTAVAAANVRAMFRCVVVTTTRVIAQQMATGY